MSDFQVSRNGMPIVYIIEAMIEFVEWGEVYPVYSTKIIATSADVDVSDVMKSYTENYQSREADGADCDKINHYIVSGYVLGAKDPFYKRYYQPDGSEYTVGWFGDETD